MAKTLAEALAEANNLTVTENGANALKSTESALLDFYGLAGAMRQLSDSEINLKFAQAAHEDLLNAMKLLFFTRDIRGGLGERRVFRDIIKYLGDNNPEVVIKNMPLIGMFGRYDDLYSLVGTQAEPHMWIYMRILFESDVKNMNQGKSVSLLAKWIKTPDSGSDKTKKLGRLTAKKMGYGKVGYTEYCRNLKKLRAYIDIVEKKMCNNEWEDIDYSNVPSKAMAKYRKSFMKHDEDNYRKFTEKVISGEAKMHADVLTPYDIIHKVMGYWSETDYSHNARDLEAMWKSMPDMLKQDTNILAVVDTSGSMSGRPIEVAVGLGLYFAEHNKGVWHNKFINFSDKPQFIEVPAGNLLQKVNYIKKAAWEMNTNIEAVFNMILKAAISNKLSQSAIPEAIVIISDMQFDPYNTLNMGDTFHETMRKRFRQAGYELPNIIYWNVRATNASFQVKKNQYGAQLATGESVQLFKQIIDTINTTPYEAMLQVLNSERYSCVTV